MRRDLDLRAAVVTASMLGDDIGAIEDAHLMLGNITAQLLRLLDRYGAAELQAAIEETLASGAAPHQNPVRLALERRRAARGAPPPIAIKLPEHVRDKDKRVTPHRLDI
ncbi:hypothetical protein AWB74_07682 [Caballeronia arvi]|uniref:Transposase n=2 Tax=Caballeronia arvi TaxID=1777135 RepID=A0A158KZ37_9BURK|nr:hypothetical protein AWB74_07682 [Caballeronia arvi]